ncbi:outer membrane protein assembly factor BamE domain-containing protein [Geminicoccus harenae]|uniref:outer membrane protein assembly factor BamE domain-containing protein n=1 Tax=Geminicoccus harenae TaxID=2498453 RepID=UPI001CC2F5F8|nr:outer membrane protein assembly factor BamE [Geminicoccus harenae]
MARKPFLLPALMILVPLAASCTSPQQLSQNVSDTSGDRISVGTVQREIKVGMSSADVVAALGSPNMVTTDAQRRETWVYDKIATSKVQSSSSGFVFLLLGGADGSSSAQSSSQRTLTIIVNFDENNLVRDYSYRQSSF